MPGENATGGGGAVRRHNATSSIEEAPSPIAESNSPPTPRRMVPTEENTESEEYSFQEKVLLFICVGNQVLGQARLSPRILDLQSSCHWRIRIVANLENSEGMELLSCDVFLD